MLIDMKQFNFEYCRPSFLRENAQEGFALKLTIEGRLKMDLFETRKQAEYHDGFHSLNGVK